MPVRVLWLLCFLAAIPSSLALFSGLELLRWRPGFGSIASRRRLWSSRSPHAVITIQPATPEDVPTLRALAHSIWQHYYPSIISREQIDYMLTRMYDAKTIRREMADGVAWELVVRETEPVGFMSYSFDLGSRRVKLSKLYLLPAWHGRGIGQQMLEQLQSRSAELGALEIWLQVNKQNVRAIRAYERAGFSVREAVVTDIGGGFVMDDFIMVRRLGEAKE